jgi:hypothetical protein
MWRPYDTEVGKARYGKTGDGGYVILNSALGAKAIFGYGVDRDVSFENQLSSGWNIPAFVFDHTITDVPEIGPGVKFIPEGIAPVNQAPCFTLEKHLRQFGFENSEIILKIFHQFLLARIYFFLILLPFFTKILIFCILYAHVSKNN